MTSRKLILFALLAFPVVASAQRGGRGGSRGTTRPDYDQLLSEDRGGSQSLTRKDMESISPIRLLVDKRKSLTLTDDQLKGLKDLDAKLASTNDTLFRQLDSLRTEMKPNKQLSPDVERMRTRGLRASFVEVVKAIRQNYESVEPAALAVLTEPQQKTANELLDKLEKDSDDMVQEKLGGRRRGS